VLQTQIDDLNPQVVAYTCEQLLALGAWDVFTQPITMKQGRPGILLTVICPPDRVPECQDLIFRETTTLGIRHFQQQRTLLERVIERVETPYGLVDIKVARHHGRIVNAQPEFRDCVARAPGIARAGSDGVAGGPIGLAKPVARLKRHRTCSTPNESAPVEHRLAPMAC
jgi:uncharacterized protein (DUF111 family)